MTAAENLPAAAPVPAYQPRITPLHHEVARALIATFRPRMDVYAERFDLQRDVDKYNEWAKTRPGVLPMYLGAWRPVRRKGECVPVTVDAVAMHVAGLRTVGFYPSHPDDTCNSVSVDFDNHRGARITGGDPMSDASATAAACSRAGLRCLVNVSRGGAGAWLHVLPPRATPAWVARTLLLRALRDAGVRHVDEGGTFDALFPKQDKLVHRVVKVDGQERHRADIGNLFCVPIGGRWLKAATPGTHFFGTDPADLRAQLRALTEY